MNKKALISILGTASLATVLSVSILSKSGSSLFKAFANRGSANTLSLTSEKISDETSSFSEEISSTVHTAQGNPITVKCANVIDNASGWQTVLPGGYFYNPLTSSGFHNKISGIESLRFNSPTNTQLSLCYGYTLDDSSIIYSYEKDLNANSTYDLSDLNPSYFYIKNNGNTNVNISDFIVTYSCEETSYPLQDMNVLMIGNSFSDDTIFYTERIAASYGINLHIYDAYIAGCTINNHYTNITNNSATYSMRNVYQETPGNYKWNYQDSMTLSSIINSHTWNIITFQQASAEVGRASSYSNLGNLVNAVRTLVGNGPKFVWYQTWAYDTDYHDYYDYFAYFNNNQMAMFNAINNCYTSQVAPLNVFDTIIPAGTAVQNLRTSYMKDTFTRDGKHMSNVHGRYLLGLDFLSILYDIDFYKSPCSYLPPEINPSFSHVAYESVKNAHNSPLSLTNSAYSTRELGNYDLSSYTEIDAELLGCSFWNSTDSSNYNKRQSNVSGTSNVYTTTKRFTQSTLPIGSLVVIDESFGVRPEAWVNDSVQSTRPSEVYSNIIEINSSFWSGYTYRAFNIYKAGKSDLKGQYDQIFDGFHIYVPNSQMAGLTSKEVNKSYSTDATLFTSNGKNINDYHRLHLDPITGFYKCDSYYELTNSYVDDTAKKFLCTRPFYSAKNDLPSDTVIIVDSGYQWRSDCWQSYGSYSPRPGNVSTQFTVLDSSFWNGFRRRTFNVSSTSSSYVYQNYIDFMNHFRIYEPIQSIPGTPVTGVSLSESSLELTVGETARLNASIQPYYAENKTISWSSNNNSVATVSDGVVTAITAGNAVITVTTSDGGFAASCSVTVTNRVYYPEGTFSGTATVLGNDWKITIAIGNQNNGLVAIRLANTDAEATGITYNGNNNTFTITTTGSYASYTFGNITGTYDYANDRLINITCSGSIKSYVSNNGSITATRPVTSSTSYFNDCDGSTSALQSTFKRRYMSGSWQVDNSNTDRITSNTAEFVSGTGSVKRRGYSGGAVALNFQNDWSSAKTLASVQFWVYNPSNSNITLRMWGYKSTNLPSNNNFETGTVTAKANQWTYVAMGFTSAAIYNFQIADFNNTGVYLSFDNIYLF